jgi:hypothetical protein
VLEVAEDLVLGHNLSSGPVFGDITVPVRPGSRGATVFRAPTDRDRVSVILAAAGTAKPDLA